MIVPSAALNGLASDFFTDFSTNSLKIGNAVF